MSKEILFPTAPDGSLLMCVYLGADLAWQYGDTWRDTKRVAVSWVPNKVFRGSLKVKSSYKGRSAARVKVQDVETGAIYPITLKEFVALCHDYRRVMVLPTEGPMGGLVLRGWWTFKKRGQYHLLVPAEAPDSGEGGEACT